MKYLFYLIICYMHYLHTSVTYVVIFGYISILVYRYLSVCVHTQLLSQPPTLCDPMDCSPPGSSVHGFSQAGILGWIAISSSRGSSLLKDQGSRILDQGSNPSPESPALAGGFFTTEPCGKLRYVSNAYYMLGTALL